MSKNTSSKDPKQSFPARGPAPIPQPTSTFGQSAATARPFYPQDVYAPPARTGSAPVDDAPPMFHPTGTFIPKQSTIFYPAYMDPQMMYGGSLSAPSSSTVSPQTVSPATPTSLAPAKKKIIAITNPTTGEVVVPGEVIASPPKPTGSPAKPSTSSQSSSQQTPDSPQPLTTQSQTIDTTAAPTFSQEQVGNETNVSESQNLENENEKVEKSEKEEKEAESNVNEETVSTANPLPSESEEPQQGLVKSDGEKDSSSTKESDPLVQEIKSPAENDEAQQKPTTNVQDNQEEEEEVSDSEGEGEEPKEEPQEQQSEKRSVDIEVVTSPTSPTGGFSSEDGTSPRTKRAYDRNILLAFRAANTTPPVELTQTDIYIRSQRISMGTRMQGIPGLQDWKSGSSPKVTRPDARKGKRAPPPPLLPPVQRSENAYVPSFIKPQSGASATELALKKLKGILNKLTPENYEKLREQVSAIDIPDAEVLTAIIQLVFEKAVAEQHFSKMYAQLCKDIATRVPSFPSEGGQEKSFKRLLLNRCQQEFERTDAKPANFAELAKEEQAELDFKIRKRMTGNVKFIGELFKEKMLSEKIMHEVIKRLLLGEHQQPSELYIPPHEEIEVLCKFLSTVGVLLDHPKAKDYMNWYFGRMKEISRNEELPSRIRFMLLDAIDLRSNAWVPRRKEAEAKTLEQIHKEAQMEEQQKSAPKPVLQPQRTVTRLNPVSGPSTPLQTKPPMTPSSHGPDGWSVQKPARGKRGGKGDRDDDNIRQTPQKGSEKKQTRASNAFDALMSEDLQPTLRPVGKTVSKKSEQDLDSISLRPSGGRSSQPSTPATSTPSQLSPPRLILQSVPSLSEIAVDSEQQPNAGETEEEEGLDVEVFTTKLLEDFFVEQDFEDYVSRVHKKLSRNADHLKEFVHRAVTHVLEKNKSEQKLLTQLFAELKKGGVIDQTTFEEGYTEVLNFVLECDLATDLPFVFTILGTFMGRAISSSCVRLSMLESLADTYITNSETPLDKKRALELIAEAMVTIKTERGDSVLRKFLSESTFNVLRLFSPSDRYLDNFVQMFNSKGLIEFDASWFIFTELKQAATVDQSVVDKILSWIGANIDEATHTNPNVASRVLVAVLNHVSRDLPQSRGADTASSLSAIAEQLQILSAVLKQFLGSGDKCQLAALYDAHWFCWRCNVKGLVPTVFKALHGSQLVSTDALMDWKDQRTPVAEEEVTYQGHTEAVKELGEWFGAIKSK